MADENKNLDEFDQDDQEQIIRDKELFDDSVDTDTEDFGTKGSDGAGKTRKLTINESDFTGSHASSSKRKKSSSAKHTVGKTDGSAVQDKSMIKKAFVMASGVAVVNTMRAAKIKRIKKQIETLNSERTKLSNTNQGRSFSAIMNDLKTKDVQRKAEKIEKKIAHSRFLGNIISGAAQPLGRIAGRNGMAEVVSSGNMTGAARSNLATIDRAADLEIPQADSAVETPSM